MVALFLGWVTPQKPRLPGCAKFLHFVPLAVFPLHLVGRFLVAAAFFLVALFLGLAHSVRACSLALRKRSFLSSHFSHSLHRLTRFDPIFCGSRSSRGVTKDGNSPTSSRSRSSCAPKCTTLQVSVPFSRPGPRSPLPSIWSYSRMLVVGRAISSVLTNGRSNPSATRSTPISMGEDESSERAARSNFWITSLCPPRSWYSARMTSIQW